MSLRPEQVAVVVGHYNQPGAAALNLHLLRKHNDAAHPILVTDDFSPPSAVQRLADECGRYNARLILGSERYGHVGGDLRAFHAGLTFARDLGCRYLMKLSQRAIFDVPNWLMRCATLLAKTRFILGGRPSGIGGGLTIAHCRTSVVLLDVAAWTRPDILDGLQPCPMAGASCEVLFANLWRRLGGEMLALPNVSDVLHGQKPGEIWRNIHGSDTLYREAAAREGIDLGANFSVQGSEELPDYQG